MQKKGRFGMTHPSVTGAPINISHRMKESDACNSATICKIFYPTNRKHPIFLFSCNTVVIAYFSFPTDRPTDGKQEAKNYSLNEERNAVIASLHPSYVNALLD